MARGGVWIGVLTQVDNIRQGKGLRRQPLHRFALMLAERHVQRIRLLHPGDDRLAQQRAVQLAAQLDKVRDRIGVSLLRQLVGHPDAGLRRHQRQDLLVGMAWVHQRLRHGRSGSR